MAQKKIFIVHQEPRLIAPAVRALNESGYHVIIHSHLVGASGVIAREMPDLVILEMDRPIIDGGALCGLLRKNPKVANIPVLLLSSSLSEDELRQRAIAAGAQGGVQGINSPKHLVSQVEAFLLRKRPLLPPNEGQRLQNLQRYRVLDTPAEAVFDDLTRVAAIVCESPIAVVSLVDENRQWFKSKQGLDASETPRDIAFCAHTIHDREILEVFDAAADVRFAHNPLVTGAPNIRFYAGAPLTAPDGSAAGTLCVLDRVPRRLLPAQREALLALGRVATHLLEKRIQPAAR